MIAPDSPLTLLFFFLMIRRPPRSTLDRSSAASDVYKRQVHDLGAAGAVVGRTKFCVHPAPWVLGIEAVGGTKNPRLDRIIALAPDLSLIHISEPTRPY